MKNATIHINYDHPLGYNVYIDINQITYYTKVWDIGVSLAINPNALYDKIYDLGGNVEIDYQGSRIYFIKQETAIEFGYWLESVIVMQRLTEE